ncbi:rod shape-determining protein MreD [Lachnospiraceae bacterium]|nr:rod shape-determining protein MreD [Lachnospiraceae bacterium]
MRRIITIFFLIIISFLLQSTILSIYSINGMAPNLMLVLTMSFGIMRGRREGMLTGLFCGFLYDVFYGSLLGPYMLLFLVIGYLNGSFHKDFLMEDIMLPVFIIIADDFIFCFVQYVFYFLLRNRTNLLFYIVNVFLPQILFTVIATIIIYRLYVLINKALKKKVKENETA